MLKLCSFTKVKVFFLALVDFLVLANFDLFEFSAAILEKGLLSCFYLATFNSKIKAVIGTKMYRHVEILMSW